MRVQIFFCLVFAACCLKLATANEDDKEKIEKELDLIKENLKDAKKFGLLHKFKVKKGKHAIKDLAKKHAELIKVVTELAKSSKSVYAILNAIITYAKLLEIDLTKFPTEKKWHDPPLFRNQRSFKPTVDPEPTKEPQPPPEPKPDNAPPPILYGPKPLVYPSPGPVYQKPPAMVYSKPTSFGKFF